MVPLSDLAEIAKTHGAPLCGAAKAEDLSGNALEIGKILPGARSVVVLAAPHSRSAIEAADVQMAQVDTVYAYGAAGRGAQPGAGEGMGVVDAAGVITMISEEYAEFNGVAVPDAIGRHVTEVIENTRMHIVARTG